MLPFESLSRSAQVTGRLIDQFLEYARNKKAEDLEGPDWKSLEKAYILHLKWRFDYPRRLFGQKMLYSWIITFIVLLLVISGLIFSLVQLYWAVSVGDISSLETDVEIETAGRLSMRSSLVGGTVLIISLAFFYLYLKHVFAIRYPVPPHVKLADSDLMKMQEYMEESSVGKKDARIKGKRNTKCEE